MFPSSKFLEEVVRSLESRSYVRKVRYTIAGMSLVLLLYAGGSSRSGWNKPSNASSIVSSTILPSAHLQASSERSVTLLPLQLRFGGFVPRELSKPPGHYHLLVNNVSGERDLTLQLKRENGEEIGATKLKRGLPWRKTVYLAPGIYILTIESHPTWVCRLTITSQP